MRARTSLPCLLAATALAATMATATAAAFPGLHLIYAQSDAARAIVDGGPGVPGLDISLRQAPAREDPRWPAARRVGKVGGAALSLLDEGEMAARLRAGWEDTRVGGLVAVDEITGVDWSPDRSVRLRGALERLGTDARRVILYVSPAIVTRIGRVDLRDRLPDELAELLAALRQAGAVELETYHGDGTPFTRAEFGLYATRWLARWSPTDQGRLHLLLARATGTSQEDLWARARSSPAGRAILANGAGAYGLRDAPEGADWLRALRAFEAQPTTPPPGGDVRIPVGGGLTVHPPGPRLVRVVLSRPARAVVRLISVATHRSRVIAKIDGPTPPSGRAVPLPRDVRPGRYRIVTVALGEGLRDVSNVPWTPPARRRSGSGS